MDFISKGGQGPALEICSELEAEFAWYNNVITFKTSDTTNVEFCLSILN